MDRHIESEIGNTASERKATLERLLDDATIEFEDKTAFFLGEAIGKLTKEGEWDKRWKSYGLYSALNDLAELEIKFWDPDNIIGRLDHIHQREFEGLTKLQSSLIDGIRKDPDNAAIRELALQELEQAKQGLMKLNDERAQAAEEAAYLATLQPEINKIKQSLFRLQLADDAAKNALQAQTTASIKAEKAYEARLLYAKQAELRNSYKGKAEALSQLTAAEYYTEIRKLIAEKIESISATALRWLQHKRFISCTDELNLLNYQQGFGDLSEYTPETLAHPYYTKPLWRLEEALDAIYLNIAT